MERRKRILSVVLAATMVGGTLAGCSGQGGDASKDTGSAQSTQGAQESKGETGDASSGEKVSLTIMHMGTEEGIKNGDIESIMMHQVVENFKAKYPDVDLKEEIVGQEAGYETKIKTLAAANEIPDLAMLLPSMMSSFYENGQILDLAPVLKEESEWADTFADGMFGDYTFGDQILGIPRCSIANHVIYYNTEIFKECGMDSFPADEVEFKEAVQKLKEKGYIPLATGNKGKYAIASQVMPGILMKFNNSDWYEKVKNYDGASFEDPDAVAAIKYMEELMQMGLFNENVNSLDPNQARQLYYDKKAAMYIEGSWSVSNLISEAPQEILDATDMTIFPTVKGKEDLKNQIVGGQGWGISISSNVTDAQKAAAINFLKEMSAPEIQTLLIEGGSLATARNIEYDESKLNPLFAEFLEMYNSHDKIVGCPEVQLSTAYMDASYVGYQEMSIGAITAEELAAKLQEAHESAKK